MTWAGVEYICICSHSVYLNTTAIMNYSFFMCKIGGMLYKTKVKYYLFFTVFSMSTDIFSSGNGNCHHGLCFPTQNAVCT